MVNDAVFCVYEKKFKKIFISQMMIILLCLVEYPASNRSIITNTTSKVYQIKAIQKPLPSNQLQIYTYCVIYIYMCVHFKNKSSLWSYTALFIQYLSTCILIMCYFGFSSFSQTNYELGAPITWNWTFGTASMFVKRSVLHWRYIYAISARQTSL